MDLFYIDGSDQLTEGTFIWTTSGSTMSYTNWAPGEPNNSGDGEHCIKMQVATGQWNAIRCDNESPSMCEVER